MELWNLATNRYDYKFYIVVLKNIKTFFFETQFLPLENHYPCASVLGKRKRGIGFLRTPLLIGLIPHLQHQCTPFQEFAMG